MPQNLTKEDESEQADKTCSFAITEENEKDWLFLKNCSNDFVTDTLRLADLWAENIERLLLEGGTLEDIWAEAAETAKAALVAESQARIDAEVNPEGRSDGGIPVVSFQMQLKAAQWLERYWDIFGQQLYQEYIKSIDTGNSQEITPGSTSDISFS